MTVPYGFRLLYKVMRVILRIVHWTAAVLGVLAFVACVLLVRIMSSRGVAPETDSLRRIQEAAREGRLAYRLTEPNELTRMLGRPMVESRSNCDGILRVRLQWPGISAVFDGTFSASTVPTLHWLKVGGTDFAINTFQDTFGGMPVDIGSGRRVVLRDPGDLHKFDMFSGLQGVSLSQLDLRASRDSLLTLPFDSLTEWPGQEMMPEGFDPAVLLEERKNPGLGIRKLHAQGIDGQGVGIAIIDQPLLRDHMEYVGRLVHYETLGLITRMGSPQMHGPAVASIAVGKDCGVAPRASLYYFALLSLSMPDGRIYCKTVDRILRMNEQRLPADRIRVISISWGMFSRQPSYEEWLRTLERAKRDGVFIVTCDPAALCYATLAHVFGKDPDDPASYRKGRYYASNAVLLVPTANRTIASERGTTVYKYDPVGGMSWAAPYLAGLAAMAFQLDPEIAPDTIAGLLVSTATRTPLGAVVNPQGFIEAVKARTSATASAADL
jgi:hypothetical protein